MTTSCRLDGVLTAADAADRTITYRLLPYGEPGRTSVGLVTVDGPGVVTCSDPSAVVLNVEHDPLTPVGRLLSLTDTPDALHATFRVAETPAGDGLLGEAREGLRTGVSVELDGVRVKAGRLLSGDLIGAGAVVRPAFASAQALLVASDTDDDTPADDTDTDDTDDAPAESDDNPAAEPAGDQQEESTVSDTLTASAPVGVPATTTQDRTPDLSTATRLLAAAAAGERTPELLAALSDLTLTKVGHSIAPAWIGEAWNGNDYERGIVPLFAQGNLTGPKVQGWRWKTAPVGADYSGDKADVPSNAAETEAVEFTALRFAGAHDHDRAMVDFGVPEYWSSYWDAMSASYKRWSDTKALAAAKTAATAVTMTGKSAVGCVVAGALAVMPAGRPSFVLLGADAFTALAEQDPLAFLSGSVSLGDGSGVVGGLSFGTHPSLAAGDVIVGVRNAATWYELGGGAPIRAEAVNIAKGGIDTGAFGYGVLGIHDAAGLAKGTYTAPAPTAP